MLTFTPVAAKDSVLLDAHCGLTAVQVHPAAEHRFCEPSYTTVGFVKFAAPFNPTKKSLLFGTVDELSEFGASANFVKEISPFDAASSGGSAPPIGIHAALGAASKGVFSVSRHRT